MDTDYPSIEERLAAVDALFAAHPDAPIAAMADALYVDIPDSVPGDHPFIGGDNPLDLVPPDEVDRMMTLWLDAVRTGLARKVVHWSGRPGGLTEIVLIDVREAHGIFLGIAIPANGAAASAPAPLVTDDTPPRVARLTKNLGATIIEADDAFTEMFGFTADEVIGARTVELAHPDDTALIVQQWLSLVSGEGRRRARIRHRCSDGTYTWVDMVNWMTGPDTVLSELVDVTNEMRALQAAWDRQELIDQLADSLPLGVLEIDRSGALVYSNTRLHEIVAMPRCDTLVEQFVRVTFEDRRALIGAMFEVMDDGQERELPIRLDLPEGERECFATFRPLRREGGEITGAVATVDDITEQAQLQRELERRATVDALTGCLNRASALRALEDLLVADDTAGVGLIFVDLDGFKAVNDDLGHAAGDELLRQVSERLYDSVLPRDLVARFGGDEFVVVCPDTASASDTMAVAERLADVLHATITVADGPVVVRASLGVTWTADASRDAPQLIREADAAMYASKAQRAGRPVLFDTGVALTRVRRVADEDLLRRAIEDGELAVHYQPIVRLHDRAVMGYEALARWHRDGRIVPAGEFIEIAERSGLVHAIDAFVIDEVCRVAAHHLEPDGFAPAFGINVSPLELSTDGLADVVTAAMHRHGTDPTRLFLEVTEHEVLHRSDTALATMVRLTDLGVRFSLDDFGTGWSSFEILMHLPVSSVKIPRQFVSQLDAGPRAGVIVSSIIQAATGLGAETVVEGIETEAERTEAMRRGALIGQGWLFGRPAPLASPDHRELAPLPR